MSWFFKTYQNLTSPQGELNLKFLKKLRVQINFKLNVKSRMITYILIMSYMTKINDRSVTGSKGIRLFCFRMFRNSLENLGKALESAKNKHSDKFLKFLKIFGNLWKSSEISGNLRKNQKMSQSAKNDLPAFLSFLNLQKLSKVFGNLRKSSEKPENVESS